MARQRRCSRSSAYTLALGSSFVALGTGRILLLKFSANADNKYDFLPASVNMLAEALKLLFCLLMSLRVFIREGRSCRDASRPSARTLVASLKWAVPAFLYFLDNLIIFYVMTYLQPAMAVLSSNFVILTTAVLFRLVLKRRLSWVQWAALVILFLSIVSLSTGSGGAAPASGVRRSPLTAPTNSCLLYAELLQQMRNSSADGPPGRRDAPPGRLRRFGAGHVLLLLQCFVSAAANVYNEKILKDGEQLTESIFVQNSKLMRKARGVRNRVPRWTDSVQLVQSKRGEGRGARAPMFSDPFSDGTPFPKVLTSALCFFFFFFFFFCLCAVGGRYAFGLLFNVLTLAGGPESRGLVAHCGVFYGHNVYSAALVLVTASLGLSVAFILKFRDNMFHVLSGQITAVLVAALSPVLFGFRPSVDFFLQAPAVLLAIFIYNASPPPDLQYSLRRVVNGELLKRSRGGRCCHFCASRNRRAATKARSHAAEFLDLSSADEEISSIAGPGILSYRFEPAAGSAQSLDRSEANAPPKCVNKGQPRPDASSDGNDAEPDGRASRWRRLARLAARQLPHGWNFLGLLSCWRTNRPSVLFYDFVLRVRLLSTFCKSVI
ncbi:UDP-sugar transporter protein SLC35A5 isoform X2 [Syngnathoides biaculeatus]|nr:UDP-sugar transporter protein SLC35A5 isoform X2 [Syngnathoides biaculeatus]XP_061679800.1 UDP-sugar transporter protein SLC35A5 isoform X2 [Syngnathoides biaculeatus]XP_061679801.1 UDP-sugar transporter protein SLC35A5 isoform X2 [Syngnathoides biaculeatus]XP_061679802.1 UDP-sugar transporter protein SLC35A5 isoform X2 [Syngnathoides biaculeatus]XP_061679803.1 UDP-sugar transporter protein SLC35A5 isoform X2 [Syngnathoides biaculeatus]